MIVLGHYFLIYIIYFEKVFYFKKQIIMVKRGKNINLYLIDGDVNRRIKCTLANWTGVIFKIP